MSTVAGHGIVALLPAGWEGRVYSREPDAIPRSMRLRAADTATITRSVLHLATFALPATVGDFGGGAVDVMRGTDLFIALFEYDTESASTPLFSATGLPRLRITDFDPSALRKLLDGQSGVQRFFTVRGRPFCLYVVLGSHARRVRTVPLVNDVLRGIEIA